jgi:alpha-tubulin suppressor-like RCC1 family protein
VVISVGRRRAAVPGRKFAADHTCAVGNDRRLYCWGRNDFGQVGDGTTTDRSSPVPVAAGAVPDGVHLIQISAGAFHTCALGSDRRAYCWGENV